MMHNELGRLASWSTRKSKKASWLKWVILLLGCLGLIFSFVLLMTVIRFRQTYNQKTFDQLTGYVKTSQKEFKELRSEMDLVKNNLLDLSVEVKRVLIDMTKFD